MPLQPLRCCTYPGCPTLVTEGRCERHPYPRKVYRDRPSASARGYGPDWQRKRAEYLSNNPRCEIEAKCDGARAREVDHIKPLSQGGERLDDANLQSACKPCHSWKTQYIDPRTAGGGVG